MADDRNATPLSGHDLALLMSALVWVKDCPFSRVPKPDVGMALAGVDELDEKLGTEWLHVRDTLGLEAARRAVVSVDLTPVERRCLRSCLEAVLEECAGNPLELQLRVGEEPEVRRLADLMQRISGSE